MNDVVSQCLERNRGAAQIRFRPFVEYNIIDGQSGTSTTTYPSLSECGPAAGADNRRAVAPSNRPVGGWQQLNEPRLLSNPPSISSSTNVSNESLEIRDYHQQIRQRYAEANRGANEPPAVAWVGEFVPPTSSAQNEVENLLQRVKALTSSNNYTSSSESPTGVSLQKAAADSGFSNSSAFDHASYNCAYNNYNTGWVDNGLAPHPNAHYSPIPSTQVMLRSANDDALANAYSGLAQYTDMRPLNLNYTNGYHYINREYTDANAVNAQFDPATSGSWPQRRPAAFAVAHELQQYADGDTAHSWRRTDSVERAPFWLGHAAREPTVHFTGNTDFDAFQFQSHVLVPNCTQNYSLDCNTAPFSNYAHDPYSASVSVSAGHGHGYDYGYDAPHVRVLQADANYLRLGGPYGYTVPSQNPNQMQHSDPLAKPYWTELELASQFSHLQLINSSNFAVSLSPSSVSYSGVGVGAYANTNSTQIQGNAPLAASSGQDWYNERKTPHSLSVRVAQGVWESVTNAPCSEPSSTRPCQTESSQQTDIGAGAGGELERDVAADSNSACDFDFVPPNPFLNAQIPEWLEVYALAPLEFDVELSEAWALFELDELERFDKLLLRLFHSDLQAIVEKYERTRQLLSESIEIKRNQDYDTPQQISRKSSLNVSMTQNVELRL